VDISQDQLKVGIEEHWDARIYLESPKVQVFQVVYDFPFCSGAGGRNPWLTRHDLQDTDISDDSDDLNAVSKNVVLPRQAVEVVEWFRNGILPSPSSQSFQDASI
jgi:hypothetical protein